MFKVTIIGAGNVGATAAQYIAMRNIADVVLVDINEGAALGKSLDMLQTGPITLHYSHLEGSNSYDTTANSDVVVITAGVPRKEGMSRDDLLKINANIVKAAAEQAIKYSPNAVFIIVTNPLDVMTQLAYQVTGLPRERVLGMAGVLDSARFQTFIAMELEVSPVDVKAMVLGGHGDLMVPLLRHSSVNGIPVLDLIDAERMKELAVRTRDGGAEIVKHLKSGSAYYGPGASVALMVEAILRDENRLVPCSVLTAGEYGLDGVYVGLPVVLGKGGMKRIVTLGLSGEEQAALARSAASIAANVKTMNELIGWGKSLQAEAVAVVADKPAGNADSAPVKADAGGAEVATVPASVTAATGLETQPADAKGAAKTQ